MKGAYVLNGPRVSLVNAFLSFMYRTPLTLVPFFLFMCFAVVAVLYAALLMAEPAGCGPEGKQWITPIPRIAGEFTINIDSYFLPF